MTHTLVAHFREEHGGESQEILMRVLSKHATPLDRQVKESLNILKFSATPEECLNNKSEWGGSKLPSLVVASAKGTSRKEGGGGSQETVEKGDKRARDLRGRPRIVRKKDQERRKGKTAQ